MAFAFQWQLSSREKKNNNADTRVPAQLTQSAVTSPPSFLRAGQEFLK